MDEQAARDRSPAPVAVQPGHGPSPERFESFYLREFRKVVALTYALSGSGLVAEDLAQEAFVAASQRWEVVGRYQRPEAWVRRVAANMAGRRPGGVVLSYLAGESVAEVAATLGLAEGTVKAHLSRARRALSQQLTTSGEETP